MKCIVITAWLLFENLLSPNFVFIYFQDVSLPTSTSTSNEAVSADEYVAIPENIREFMTEVRLLCLTFYSEEHHFALIRY